MKDGEPCTLRGVSTVLEGVTPRPLTKGSMAWRFLPYEWYARDSSRKINAVFTDRMERGLRCSGAIPYGYYRKPDDKQTLYVDEEAAKVVRRMISEFIDKIIVHESNGVRGFGRKQKIEIYFNFIGQFIPPIPEEEIREEAEKQAAIQAEKNRIRAEKRKATLVRYNAKKEKRLEELRLAVESGDPEAKEQYEEHCRKEEEKRERSKAYFKERYRREQEKYANTKALAEQGDPQAIELLAEYDRRIAYRKKRVSEQGKAKRRAEKEARENMTLITANA